MSSSDVELRPPEDSISSLAFSGDSSKLLVSSWDGTLQLHDVSNLNDIQNPQTFNSPAAILSSTFGSSSSTAYSGGLDKRVREWDFATGQNRVLGKHDDTVQTVTWCQERGIVATGSWDKTVKVFDPRTAAQISSNTVNERIYSASIAPTSNLLVVSMAHRNVAVYDIRSMAEPVQQRESALKFMTRSIACMIDGKGWAAGSIEGRIAVEYFDADPAVQSLKYAFRCHRQTKDGVDTAYPINAMAYHPIHNTFISGGSDGHISVWDHISRKRMKLYAAYPTEIAALAFSPDGSKLAIGASYEYDNGLPDLQEQGKRGLFVKTTVMDDCRPKSAKAAA